MQGSKIIVRYSVAGQAFWDNKNGANYMATFTMGKVESAPIFPDQETFPGLRNELETMSQSDDLSGPAFLAERWTFGTAVYQPADPDIACFRTSASFGSRYDIASSKSSMGSPRDINSIHRQHIAVEDKFKPIYFDLTRVKCQLLCSHLGHRSSIPSTPSTTDCFMSSLLWDENAQSLSPDTNYRQFINKFVFLWLFSFLFLFFLFFPAHVRLFSPSM